MESPKKRQKVLSSTERTCIICSKQTSETCMTKARDDQSIGALVEAARIRNFHPILTLEEHEYDEKLFYHRDCRSKFTHKKTLQQFNKELDSEAQCSRQRRSSRGPATTSRVLDSVCIFCEKKSKYVPGSNTRETLLQSRELRSGEAIRRVAQDKLDDRMLAITARDLVAAEAHYHKSCYRKYTRGKKKKTSVLVDKDDEAYQAAEQESYTLLFQYVRDTLFAEPTVLRMTEVTGKLVSYLQSFGINDVRPHTKKHIRRKLECEFKESLHFVSDDKGKLLVYPDNLSLDQVVVAMMKAEEQLREVKHSENIDNIVKLSANHLRGQIKKIKPKPWPPHPAELNSDYIEVPESLQMFLKLLLHGETQEGTQKLERAVQSIGQDCIYAVSRGRVVPAKHILLPWGVKSLTGNVELIKMLNRLGLGVSYSKLEEIDTALCLQKQRREADQGRVNATKKEKLSKNEETKEEVTAHDPEEAPSNQSEEKGDEGMNGKHNGKGKKPAKRGEVKEDASWSDEPQDEEPKRKRAKKESGKPRGSNRAGRGKKVARESSPEPSEDEEPEVKQVKREAKASSKKTKKGEDTPVPRPIKYESLGDGPSPVPSTGRKYMGSHVSAAGGIWNAFENAVECSSKSFAIFLRNQRQWHAKPLDEETVEKWKEAGKDFAPHLILPHGSYLMNLGSPVPETLEKSRSMLVDELQRCQRLGIPHYNFHPGSTTGKISREECCKMIAESINIAHSKTEGVICVLENMSRQGFTIGGDLHELRLIIEHVKDRSRVGVCLDTCHSHAAGYDLSSKEGFDELLQDFETIIGWQFLRGLHINDSKGKVGDHLDRHENIGKGTIGIEGFRRVMNCDRFNDLPLILETPWTSNAGYASEVKKLESVIKT